MGEEGVEGGRMGEEGAEGGRTGKEGLHILSLHIV